MAGAMSCRKAMDLFIASTPMDAQNGIEPSGVHRGESANDRIDRDQPLELADADLSVGPGDRMQGLPERQRPVPVVH